MRIIINHSSMTPIYEQIVEQVKTLIRNEKLMIIFHLSVHLQKN